MTSARPTPTSAAPKVSGCSRAAAAAASVGNVSGRRARKCRTRSGMRDAGRGRPKTSTTPKRSRSGGGRLPGRGRRFPRGAQCGARHGAPARTPSRETSLAELLLERLLYHRVDELRHVAAEARHFAHEARAQVGEIERRDQEHRLDARRQVAVHERHLELVLEVAHRPQAPHDHRRPHGNGELREQPVEGANLHAGILDCPPDQDRKSTRLNSSHSQISYAVFCLKKKKTKQNEQCNSNRYTRLLTLKSKQ